jgi:hypothetical protein
MEVSIPKYEPYPVEPGSYFDLWVNAQNIGSNDINAAEIKIIPSYPFSLDPTESDTHVTGTLKSGQEEVFKFKVRVDNKAVEGSNTLKLEYKYGGFDAITKDFSVLVQTRNAILGISEIKNTPESFVPGRVSYLDITLENLANSALNGINVKLDLTNGSLPFTVTNTTSEQRISVLEAGEKQTVSFDILTFPSAVSQIYKVPLTITYYDNVGKQYTKNEAIGFTVGDVPVIDLILDKTTIKQANSAGAVTLEVVNRGLAGIKFMTIELMSTNDFVVVSSGKLYIGKLDSDDTDSFDMNIFVKSTSKSSIELPVHMTYLDSNNKAYDVTEKVQLNLYSGSEISKYGLDGGNNTAYIVVGIIALLGIGWFVYNRWFKKR